MKLTIILTSLLIVCLPLGVPGTALAGNLITDGTFTNTSPGTWSNSLLMDSPDDSNGTISVAGWSRFGPSVYLATDPTQDTEVWGPGNGVANGLTNSPAGGNLVMINASPQNRSGIEQTVSGLNVGDTYQLTFYDGAAQQAGVYGPTTSYMSVTFGSDTQSGSSFSIASQGWSGWNLETMSFVATASNEILSFTGVGVPNIAPYMLIDGVTLTDLSVPEPSSLVLMVAGVGGASVFALRRRARAVAGA